MSKWDGYPAGMIVEIWVDGPNKGQQLEVVMPARRFRLESAFEDKVDSVFVQGCRPLDPATFNYGKNPPGTDIVAVRYEILRPAR